MQTQFDVIVIGLGAMGSATVYQLAKRGANVLGIDQFDPPHTLGSSHGETRITRRAVGEGIEYYPLVQRSNEIWSEIESLTGTTLHHQSGGLIICPKADGAQFHGQEDFVTRTANLAKQFEVEHQLLSSGEIPRITPVINAQSHQHAYYEPQAGVLRPARCIKAQLDLAIQHGATIHRNEPVINYDVTDNHVIVKTAEGEYHAEKIVVATGAWIINLMPEVYKGQLQIFRQVIYWFEADDMTKFQTGQFPWVIWIGDTLDDFLCLFPIPDNGTQAVKMMTETYHGATHPKTLKREVDQAEIDHMYHTILRDKVVGITPKCIKSDVCMYTVTPDEHFIIDFHPDSERIILASPCSGHGFKHSSAIGEILSQLALDGQSTYDIRSFSLSRFQATTSSHH